MSLAIISLAAFATRVTAVSQAIILILILMIWLRVMQWVEINPTQLTRLTSKDEPCSI